MKKKLWKGNAFFNDFYTLKWWRKKLSHTHTYIHRYTNTYVYIIHIFSYRSNSSCFISFIIGWHRCWCFFGCIYGCCCYRCRCSPWCCCCWFIVGKLGRWPDVFQFSTDVMNELIHVRVVLWYWPLSCCRCCCRCSDYCCCSHCCCWHFS